MSYLLFKVIYNGLDRIIGLNDKIRCNMEEFFFIIIYIFLVLYSCLFIVNRKIYIRDFEMGKKRCIIIFFFYRFYVKLCIILGVGSGGG